VVRLFGLRDFFLLRRLRSQCVGFDLRRLLLDAPSPVSSALLGYLTHHHLGAITCIHEDTIDGRDLQGFAQVWPRAGRSEWDLGWVAPRLSSPRDVALWRRQLSDLVLFGAERGVLRIYARSSEDAQIEDVLRQTGFIVISREEVFVRPSKASLCSQPTGLRPSGPQDRWALGELYRQAVPQIVRRAEGLPSRRMRPPFGSLPSSGLTAEYVWVDEGRIVAYLGLYSSLRGNWLEVVSLPECRAETLPHVRYMLTLVSGPASTPVYCPVPDYAAGLGWVLRALEFEPYARQVLLVAHTAARVPVHRKVRVMGLEGSADARTPVGHVYTGESVG